MVLSLALVFDVVLGKDRTFKAKAMQDQGLKPQGQAQDQWLDPQRQEQDKGLKFGP